MAAQAPPATGRKPPGRQSRGNRWHDVLRSAGLAGGQEAPPKTAARVLPAMPLQGWASRPVPGWVRLQMGSPPPVPKPTVTPPGAQGAGREQARSRGPQMPRGRANSTAWARSRARAPPTTAGTAPPGASCGRPGPLHGSSLGPPAPSRHHILCWAGPPHQGRQPPGGPRTREGLPGRRPRARGSPTQHARKAQLGPGPRGEGGQ